MSPPLSVAYDLDYTCTTCDRDHLTRAEDFSECTWTCHTCGDPVHVHLADDGGVRRYRVERVMTRELVEGDRILLDGALASGPLYIYQSAPAENPRQWFLVLKGDRGRTFAPDQYQNRIL